VLACLRLGESDVVGSHGELAAVRHGIASVDHQIDRDLLQLTQVRSDHLLIKLKIQSERDALADESPNHLLNAKHQHVQVECPGLDEYSGLRTDERLMGDFKPRYDERALGVW